MNLKWTVAQKSRGTPCCHAIVCLPPLSSSRDEAVRTCGRALAWPSGAPVTVPAPRAAWGRTLTESHPGFPVPQNEGAGPDDLHLEGLEFSDQKQERHPATRDVKFLFPHTRNTFSPLSVSSQPRRQRQTLDSYLLPLLGCRMDRISASSERLHLSFLIFSFFVCKMNS